MLCQQAFGGSRHYDRTTRMIFSQLACMGRHSLAGLISTAGRQFKDWSADCRLFSEARFDQEAGFQTVLDQVLLSIPQGKPLIVGMDDTIVRKAGKHTHGSKWRRDPLGPPFQVNLVRAQRYFQISAALPLGDHGVRMIPVDLVHAPTRPKTDDPTVTQIAVSRLHRLRQQLDEKGPQQALWVVADAGFTNKTVLRDLPERTTIIGRVRKDAKLYYPPDQPKTKGRARVYGEQAPRPGELAKDKNVAWTSCYVRHGGRRIRLRYKTITGLKSRNAGAARDLRLIVVAPRRYKLRKGGRYLYKAGCHLICTDPEVAPKDLLQAYLYRWDLEVNFREQKAILGMEETLVRTENSTQLQPALVAIAYALLHLAERNVQVQSLPPAKWRRKPKVKTRITTAELLRVLRQQLWFTAFETFSDFAPQNPVEMKPEEVDIPLQSAVIYACSA